MSAVISTTFPASRKSWCGTQLSRLSSVGTGIAYSGYDPLTVLDDSATLPSEPRTI
jgi:hypothetical protein